MKSEFCGFRCTEKFLEDIDARANSLHMTRSQYILQALRQEILSGGKSMSIVAEQAAVYGGKISNNPAARKRRRRSK